MAGIQILPANDKYAGLRLGAQNFVQSYLQQQQKTEALQKQQQQEQAMQQIGQKLGIQFPTGTSPQVAAMMVNNAMQQTSQKPQAGFTLSPGQARYDASGQQIASVAEKPEVMSPSQQISQKKLALINKLQEKVASGTANKSEETQLDKMLSGQAAVNISFGKSTAAERTAIAETQASLDSVDNLESLFNSSLTRTGVISGRVEPTKGLLGLTTAEQEDFMAATSEFKNAVIKDITGAQMSEAEATRILKQVPDITDPPVRWKAKLKQTRRNLQEIQKRRGEVLSRSGIKSPLDMDGSMSKENLTVEDLDNLTLEQLQSLGN